MKLRNKKTGEIIDLSEGLLKDAGCGTYITLRPIAAVNKTIYEYKSLTDFVDNWEDCKPTEPLIKDEKIRKAVRAWVEANKFSSKMFFTYYANLYQLSCWQASIEFNSPIDGLKDGKEYYFTELCGEEE